MISGHGADSEGTAEILVDFISDGNKEIVPEIFLFIEIGPADPDLHEYVLDKVFRHVLILEHSVCKRDEQRIIPFIQQPEGILIP